MGAGFLVVLAVIGGAVFVFSAAGKAKRRREDAVAVVRGELEASQTASDGTISGTFHDIATTFRYATRGSGKSKQSWTHVECTLPKGYPLALHVRRHGFFDVNRIDAGKMVDVRFDDPAFDDAFLVEAAPADVVRRMIGPALRAYLLAHRQIDLDTFPDRGVLRLGIRGHVYDRLAIEAALEHTARLAASLRDATAAADAAVGYDEGGTAYRPMADDRALQAARAARLAEVERVIALRRGRRFVVQAVAVGIFVVVLIIMLRGLT